MPVKIVLNWTKRELLALAADRVGSAIKADYYPFHRPSIALGPELHRTDGLLDDDILVQITWEEQEEPK